MIWLCCPTCYKILSKYKFGLFCTKCKKEVKEKDAKNFAIIISDNKE